MEEALWRLEDRWKLSTREAIAALSICAICILIIGLVCLLIRMRRRSKSKGSSVYQDPSLVGTARWSEASQWDRGGLLDEVGWGRSHSSSSAVWQRPILMGEKCELPRFSGLILYDQMGLPLSPLQESPSPSPATDPNAKATLRDYLLLL